MKEVGVISIKPRHVCNILNGDKTLEIRTTCPKKWKDYIYGKTNEVPEPMDFYIYCTNRDKYYTNTLTKLKDGRYYIIKNPDDCLAKIDDIDRAGLTGMVLAKFTLKKVEMDFVENVYKKACVTK